MTFGRFNYSQQYIEHDYKEIAFPANAGWHAEDGRALLHIWPRRYSCSWAWATRDGGFTGTLFMPNTASEVAPGFDRVKEEQEVKAFFRSTSRMRWR
jgi:kynurenine 3-monooxygenase